MDVTTTSITAVSGSTSSPISMVAPPKDSHSHVLKTAVCPRMTDRRVSIASTVAAGERPNGTDGGQNRPAIEKRPDNQGNQDERAQRKQEYGPNGGFTDHNVILSAAKNPATASSVSPRPRVPAPWGRRR